MFFDIEKIVKDCLGSELLADLVETKFGWVARKNDDVFKGAKYLISFNHPTNEDEFDFISQYIRDADVATIKNLYKSTNGMRILGDRFVVPGVRFLTPEQEGLDFFNIPIGIDLVSGIEYPEFAPVDGAVVGSFKGYSKNSKPELLDIVTEKSNIISGYFHESEKIVSVFDGIEQWIEQRLQYAKDDFSNSQDK